ncbi:unnamed protein product [Caenorhabditis sp. 36 PRJEB53466]|nr:unnamed protein product [Caenorhabditis sp. 36 PRJEB53466]
MKRVHQNEQPSCWKRYCSASPELVPPENRTPMNETKQFYSGENGIIELKKNIISIVDPKPRTVNQYVLAALRKPGTYFVQTKSSLIGPFFTTPTPADCPKGELVMIYECCSRFSETSTSCFRPIGLLQN